MSAGQLSEGLGCITWWGFSPARDLLSMGKNPMFPEETWPSHMQCQDPFFPILFMY